MKDKCTENFWLTVTEGWSKTSHLLHSRVRIANDVMKLWSFHLWAEDTFVVILV